MEHLDLMIAWGNGELDDAQTVQLFQALVDSGVVWKLQGCYGRMAERLIEEGKVSVNFRLTVPQRPATLESER